MVGMRENIETLVDVSPPGPGEQSDQTPELSAERQDTIRDLVRQTRASGAAVTGPDGLGEAAGHDGRRGGWRTRR